MINITKDQDAAVFETSNEPFGGFKTFTIPEVAALLRINRNVAYAAARRGEIPTIKFGRAIRVPAFALQRLLGEADQ